MSRATIPPPPVLILTARTAKDLMSENPVSLHENAAVPEAVAVMTDRGYSAAPVIDEAGRPVGVLSRTDILVHDREQVRHAQPVDEREESHRRHSRREGYSIEIADSTRVRDIMTPTVFTVSITTPTADVVRRMCELKVHQLFVVDSDNALVGVVSALDIVRHLTQEK